MAQGCKCDRENYKYLKKTDEFFFNFGLGKGFLTMTQTPDAIKG